MPHTPSRWIAASSLILLAAIGMEAARRPRYGGELRIETASMLTTLNPAEDGTSVMDGFSQSLLSQIFETLVCIDESGQTQPLLATSWTHEALKRAWTFRARSGVLFHDGAPWQPPEGIVTVPDKKAVAPTLGTLSQLSAAIVSSTGSPTPAGTGPFRIAGWESGKRIRLEAFDSYWGGRPFLDAVEIRRVHGTSERLLDLDLAKADVVEVQLTDVRRLQRQGVAVRLSRPGDSLALVFESSSVPPAVRQALSFVIDRVTIHRVLLDRQGEISSALLPQWLSGYAFLFSTERELNRAKVLAANAAPLRFAYDASDPLIRSVAERIIVNANEAGLVLHAGDPGADVRLRRLPLLSFDARQALELYAELLHISVTPSARPYDLEKSLLKEVRVIPLFHLPTAYALRGNVQNWTTLSHLDDVWLDMANKK